MNRYVDQALYNQVKDVANSLGCKVSYPNRVFSDEDKGTLFLEPTIFTASNEPLDINEGCNNLEVGFLQISVFTQGNSGLKANYDAIDEIKVKFKRDTRLEFNGQVVRIRRNIVRNPISDPDWYILPIDIEFRAETPN